MKNLSCVQTQSFIMHEIVSLHKKTLEIGLKLDCVLSQAEIVEKKFEMRFKPPLQISPP
ncbi:hypothetical protein F981_04248 [Acinetobacter guillouiae CIP 63.46]|nr:hypothetical protein F981_04248 [Acinetobacter guillouiae CIP 63.46]